jgi:hypothetical protein
MRFFKTLITLATLAAVAAQPALAALQPCCCVKKVEVEKACCAAKDSADPSAAARNGERPDTTAVTPADSCRARKTAAEKTAASAIIQATGCCCVKAPPAVPTSRDQAKQVSEQQPSKQPPLVPALAAVDLFDAAPAARCVAHTTELQPRSGPPLLALYCIWRK